jgi:hypothetical protein
VKVNKNNIIKRLNIFVDETGDFGLSKGSSGLYGVSFTFHEQIYDITSDITKLNNNLDKLGYTNMIHMADLVMRRGDYQYFKLAYRKRIFISIYQFARKIPVKYKTVIVEKKYTDNVEILKKKLDIEINSMLETHKEYFAKFDIIVMYYDNGQEILGKILDSQFIRFKGFEHRKDFNHTEKRLFQVSDMLTYIDKYEYKKRNKIPFTNSEKYFFNTGEINKILKELNKKRL